MIDPLGKIQRIKNEITSISASSVVGRAVTHKLHVSLNGNSYDGSTWDKAFQTIQEALAAASTDANDLTLILISPHDTYYDMDTIGDPTYSANVILKGSHRNWVEIRNTHGSATSILKLTGKSGIIDLNFNLGVGAVNGLILTHGGARVISTQFVGTDLTGAATALWLDHATGGKHGAFVDLSFLGHVTHMTGILVDQFGYSQFDDVRIHDCLTGVQIVGANADSNQFRKMNIGGCVLALDIDAGNTQHFNDILLHDNTLNVDDEVGDHHWHDIWNGFNITLYPETFTGVTVIAHNNADEWGNDTEIRAAATAIKPFRIVGYAFAPGIVQYYRVRFSADSGATFFDDLLFDAVKDVANVSPSGTETIFNAGTRISASAKAETGGEDTVQVWLKIQEI